MATNGPFGEQTGWPALGLAVVPPFPPMEAKSVETIPRGEPWQYEPKWDGFRCLAFREGATVVLQSKAGQPLTRYFPELETAVRTLPFERLVVDGEILVPRDGVPSFDDLLQRIHPAASRVARLSQETPALIVVFDVLVDSAGARTLDLPLSERRRVLESLAPGWTGLPRLRTSPVTLDPERAQSWLGTLRGIDGVVAKRRDLPYASGDRKAMHKVKRIRTADCVVGAYREGVRGGIGSLLLGLYDGEGRLHHVGFCSGFDTAARAALPARLEPFLGGEGFSGRSPGGPSRWRQADEGAFVPLRPGLVIEVTFDQVTGVRFRHGTGFVRWRPDKAPEQCTMEQMALPEGSAMELLGTR